MWFCTTPRAAVDASTTADTVVETFSGCCLAHDMMVMPHAVADENRLAAGRDNGAEHGVEVVAEGVDSRPASSELVEPVPALVVGDDGPLTREVVDLRIPVMGVAGPPVHRDDHVTGVGGCRIGTVQLDVQPGSVDARHAALHARCRRVGEQVVGPIVDGRSRRHHTTRDPREVGARTNRHRTEPERCGAERPVPSLHTSPLHPVWCSLLANDIF